MRLRGYIGSEVNMDDMIWNFSLGKCLSVKVLINKENFRFVDVFWRNGSLIFGL